MSDQSYSVGGAGQGNAGALLPSLPVFNVMAAPFNAKGDGVTDDTGAIQAAINAAHAAGGGRVYFPAGTYRSDALTFFADIILLGQGREVSSLHAVTASATIFLRNNDETTTIRNVFLEDLELYLPTSGTACTTLLQFKNVGYSGVRRCRFQGNDVVGATAMILDSTAPAQTYYNRIAENQWVNCATAISVQNQANANTIEGRNIFLSGTTGIVVNNAEQTVITGNAFQDNAGGIGVQLTGGANCLFNVVAFNWLENQTTGVQLDAGVRFNILTGNQYSATTHTYLDNSGADQYILESYLAAFTDVGSIPQLVKILSHAAGLLATNAAYDRTMLHVPGDGSTTPGKVFTQLQDASGANRWVLTARGALAAPDTFSDGNTTPSVDPQTGPVFKCANSGPTSITTFTNGVPGQVIYVILDNNTTLVAGASLQLLGDVNLTGSTRAVVCLVNNGGGQWVDSLRRTTVTYGTITATTQSQGRRFAGTGTAHVAGDYALSAGWGTTATVSAVSAKDTSGRVTVSSAGTGQTANPTVTLTFKDGTWTTIPNLVAARGELNSPAGSDWMITSVTATQVVFTFQGTPVAGTTYVLCFMAMGN